MSTTALTFDAITNEERGLFDDIRFDVYTKFEQVINALNTVADDDKAGQLVAYLTSYSPEKLDKAGLNPDDFTEYTWTVVTYIAACIPPEHPAQDVLVQVLLRLQGSEEPWKDLPGFGMFMRHMWNKSPTFDAVDDSSSISDDDPPLSLSEWLNLNSFAARIFQDVQPSFRSFGIWELRSGLEEDVSTDVQDKPFPQAVAEARVRVASEWIIRAGDRLLKDSLLGVWAVETALMGRAYVGGELIPATRGLNLERWGFWKRRLGELRNGVQEETVRRAIDRALAVMTALEMKAAERM
ncbi:hypothetical protein VMCG_03448 [Cytospora schulzeri]|uniref:Uncharacterized protein n=1 Tax=Cytospora schulzeri TaxID=448051 RepID=A0A423WWM6_9PEZI|nr:hypothetical protein VMCG_03448 [Valsa malicola]